MAAVIAVVGMETGTGVTFVLLVEVELLEVLSVVVVLGVFVSSAGELDADSALFPIIELAQKKRKTSGGLYLVDYIYR